MTADNLAIRALADSEADLRERLADLEAERAMYRALAQAALGNLHALTQTVARLTRIVRAQRIELLRYTASQITDRRAA